MQTEQFLLFVQQFHRDQLNLLERKGTEYAVSDDRLAHFKRAGENFGITPIQAAGVFAGKHWDSIRNHVKLLSDGFEIHSSEPIRSRCLDMANYCLFLAALFAEDELRAAEALQQFELDLNKHN